MADYQIISSDNHVFEPRDMWTSRAEPKFRDRVPRIVRMDDGMDWWWCDGRKATPLAAGTQPGRRFEEPEKLTRADVFENVRPGGYIPEEHIKDMDADGVDVSIVYPTVSFLMFTFVEDNELLTSMFRTYNDWVAEFCKPYSDRLKGIAILNVDDLPSSIQELERCANLGFAGAMITVSPPEGRSYDSPMYEPLWATAQDLAMPLSLHISTNRPAPGQRFATDDAARPSGITNADHWVRVSLTDIILSGVFERYPRLHVGSVEHELSWVPHFLDRMDYTYTQRPQRDFWYRFKDDMLPSDYFHRNVFVGFQEDDRGIRDRYDIGVDNLQWESDYPHPESTFPRTQHILEDILADCTEEEKAKIAGGNAARVYHLA